jgi:4-diphosphocytidyl-2-C-methyl-D-erythritol kinase
VLKALRAAPHCRAAALSGSGATCFGLFPTRDARTEAAARIKTAHPDWWVAGTWIGGTG